MSRRSWLKSMAALAAVLAMPLGRAAPRASGPVTRRVRPGDPGWPTAKAWLGLEHRVGGRLTRLDSPWSGCIADPGGADCTALFKSLRNPYFIGDSPVLTQTLGWVDAWTSKPSVCAVAARSSADVAAAVDFAREHRLRLVVKGGGHSYLGTSNAPDSLLVWTRAMNAIELHDAFVPKGSHADAQPAVSVGAGAVWMHVYDAVTTKGGRYVQGGGCGTVGVAGLIQSGGFGSLSKAFGTAAASLLEAEVVTADGKVRIANAALDPDLFWALKGGGGGSFGVVTRVTLRTHVLPPTIGAVFMTIEARSSESYRQLVDDMLAFYQSDLMNPHWGEQIRFLFGRKIAINLVFQGLDQDQAQAVWQPFIERLTASPDYIVSKPFIAALPAQRFWDPAFWKDIPGIVKTDDRPGAPPVNIWWTGNSDESGQVLTGYHSAWLPAKLLDPANRDALVDALVFAANNWSLSLHFNKGLAGASDATLAASRDTATNPAVLDAFALAICAGELPPSHAGIDGHEVDVETGRANAASIRDAFAPIGQLLAQPASYVSESDFFERRWTEAYWGSNHARLAQLKRLLDPDGLFYVHHGVGSEQWKEGGFERI